MTTPKLITAAAADFLTSPKTRKLLSPFMERARSIVEAAALLELKFPALHRRVRQMVKLGLLETFVTDGFRGSAAVLGRGVAKEMTACAPRWGSRIFWDDGVFQQATALGEDGTLLEPDAKKRSVYGGCTLQLTQTDAQVLGDELQALYEKYLALGKAEGEPYFLSVGFTPL